MPAHPLMCATCGHRLTRDARAKNDRVRECYAEDERNGRLLYWCRPCTLLAYQNESAIQIKSNFDMIAS